MPGGNAKSCHHMLCHFCLLLQRGAKWMVGGKRQRRDATAWFAGFGESAPNCSLVDLIKSPRALCIEICLVFGTLGPLRSQTCLVLDCFAMASKSRFGIRRRLSSERLRLSSNSSILRSASPLPPAGNDQGQCGTQLPSPRNLRHLSTLPVGGQGGV